MVRHRPRRPGRGAAPHGGALLLLVLAMVLAGAQPAAAQSPDPAPATSGPAPDPAPGAAQPASPATPAPAPAPAQRTTPPVSSTRPDGSAHRSPSHASRPSGRDAQDPSASTPPQPPRGREDPRPEPPDLRPLDPTGDHRGRGEARQPSHPSRSPRPPPSRRRLPRPPHPPPPRAGPMRRAILIAAARDCRHGRPVARMRRRPRRRLLARRSPRTCRGFWHDVSRASRLAGRMRRTCPRSDLHRRAIDWRIPAGQRGVASATAPMQTSWNARSTIQLDSTAPVDDWPSRPVVRPDANGWYRSPVQVRFAGADATLGRAWLQLGHVQRSRCRGGSGQRPLLGPRGQRQRARDLRPSVRRPCAIPRPGGRLRARPQGAARVERAGRGGRRCPSWRAKQLMSGGPSGCLVDRGLRNGHRYEYVVSATDAAGNTAKKTLAVIPGPRLFGPAEGARLDGPPRLRWTSVRGADYYNVQLFRGRRKILSLWPEKPHLQLRSKWRYAGHKRRLKPGKRYRWFVWPGEGRRSSSDYGRLIGARTFVITP